MTLFIVLCTVLFFGRREISSFEISSPKCNTYVVSMITEHFQSFPGGASFSKTGNPQSAITCQTKTDCDQICQPKFYVESCCVIGVCLCLLKNIGLECPTETEILTATSVRSCNDENAFYYQAFVATSKIYDPLPLKLIDHTDPITQSVVTTAFGIESYDEYFVLFFTLWTLPTNQVITGSGGRDNRLVPAAGIQKDSNCDASAVSMETTNFQNFLSTSSPSFSTNGNPNSPSACANPDDCEDLCELQKALKTCCVAGVCLCLPQDKYQGNCPGSAGVILATSVFACEETNDYYYQAAVATSEALVPLQVVFGVLYKSHLNRPTVVTSVFGVIKYDNYYEMFFTISESS